MFIIPGVIISVLTFPGVMIHEWSHKKFCDWLGVPVRSVRYFRLGNPAGYVLHEKPSNYNQKFWISVGPLVINSFAAIILSFIASRLVPESAPWYLLIWIAVSAGMHAFPSDNDMGPLRWSIAFPLVALVWLANKLRFFWFDLIYAALLVGLGSGIH